MGEGSSWRVDRVPLSLGPRDFPRQACAISTDLISSRSCRHGSSLQTGMVSMPFLAVSGSGRPIGMTLSITRPALEKVQPDRKRGKKKSYAVVHGRIAPR